MSMLPHDRICAALRAAATGGEPGLVGFMTAGYPSRENFREHLADVCAGADVVEIGVPFTDPMADGVTIQRASQQALKSGVTLGWLLGELEATAPHKTPLLLMSYLNPLLAYGYTRLAEDAARAGVCGFIVPDLPLDEASDLRTALAAQGLALVQMVTPVTPPARMQRLCEASSGFVYAVTATGTTGRNVQVPQEMLDYLDRVRALAPVPVCAGFGIRGREQVERLRGHVDGVVIGSALVEVLERGESARDWLAALRSTRR